MSTKLFSTLILGAMTLSQPHGDGCNQRNDQYGDSIENCTHFLLEVTEERLV